MRGEDRRHLSGEVTAMRFLLFVCLIETLFPQTGLAQDRPLAEKHNWLDNLKNWPAYVTHEKIDQKRGDEPLTVLRKERYNAVLDEIKDRYVYWLQGESTLPELVDCSKRYFHSRLEINPGIDRLQWHQEKLEFWRYVEKQIQIMHQAQPTTRTVLNSKLVKYERLNAEIDLRLAKSREKSGPEKK
jgi:hypothetical protein